MTSLSGAPQLPADLLKTMLEGAKPLARKAESLFGAMAEHSDSLRERLLNLDTPQIVPIPPPDRTRSLAAVDGGMVVEQMYAGDLIVAASVAAEGLRSGRTGTIPHGSWSDLISPHRPDVDRLASAAMTSLELALLPSLTQDIKVFDGSHQTPVIALNSALASEDPDVHGTASLIASDFQSERDSAGVQGVAFSAVDGLRELASSLHVIALPKADTSTHLRDKYQKELKIFLPPIGDKLLATMVLRPGEMLVPRTATGWGGLHIKAYPGAKSGVHRVADLLHSAIKGMRPEPEIHPTTGEVLADHKGISITYLMPHGGETCIKVEFKTELGRHFGPMIAALLNREMPQPHMQEPYAQFIADLWAKNVSIGSDALGQAMRLELMRTGAPWLPHLHRGYRTSAASGTNA